MTEQPLQDNTPTAAQAHTGAHGSRKGSRKGSRAGLLTSTALLIQHARGGWSPGPLNTATAQFSSTQRAQQLSTVRPSSMVCQMKKTGQEQANEVIMEMCW